MSHRSTAVTIKRAVDIRLYQTLKDGLEIDWNNQYDLRRVNVPVTQVKLNETLKNHLKFIVCRDMIFMNHQYFGEKSYYTTLGLSDPRTDFESFKQYAQVSIEQCCPNMKEYAENGYVKLCRSNHVTGDIGKLFD